MRGESFCPGDVVLVMEPHEIAREFYGKEPDHIEFPIGSFGASRTRFCNQVFTISDVEDAFIADSVAPNGGLSFRYVLNPATGVYWRDYMLKRVEESDNKAEKEEWLKIFTKTPF